MTTETVDLVAAAELVRRERAWLSVDGAVMGDVAVLAAGQERCARCDQPVRVLPIRTVDGDLVRPRCGWCDEPVATVWEAVDLTDPDGQPTAEALADVLVRWVDERVEELEPVLGRRALIRHRCTGSTARAVWAGRGWRCQCSDTVRSAPVVAWGRSGIAPAVPMIDEDWLEA